MKNFRGIYLLGLCALCLWSACTYEAQAKARYSDLWGKKGEKWTPESRLPDFSFAGYHFGEKAIPKVKAVTSVKKFGAKGNGRTDDTQAFIKAIKATKSGAIIIPRGRYKITDFITISKSNIVLRGAGVGKTILYFPKELEDVKSMLVNGGKPDKRGRIKSAYSWKYGYLTMKGHFQNRTLGKIISESKRGAKTITLDKVSGLKKGQRVSVFMEDDKKRTLVKHLYSGDTGDISGFSGMDTRMVSRITSIRGNKITLERPLRFDIRKTWKPVLKSFEPKVSEVGIENLTIEFPSKKPYKGHFTERGYNAISMRDVADCWVRNIEIVNADSGIFAKGMFCTLDGITLRSDRKDFRGTTGHHGISLGQDILLQNFNFKMHFIHDIDVIRFTSGNVAKNGKAINLSLDHHAKGPYENLFCNIDAGQGDQIWRCGGNFNYGKRCGARGTFWGIRSKKNLSWPQVSYPKKDGFGPDSMNLVGLTTKDKEVKDLNGRWFEVIPPDQLKPADLHAAQLKRRLSRR